MADEPVPPAAGDESSGTSTSEVIQEEPPSSDESTESGVGARFENLTDDQVAYLNSVKDALGENSAVFSSLYQMAHDLERERTGALKFRKRARALFEEHPEHIMGLNNFLPEGYKITAASPTESVFEGGLDFLKQVEKRYKHDNQRYIDFCSILEEFRNNTINWIQASSQLGQLISDSSDLLKEFCLTFLSDFST